MELLTLRTYLCFECTSVAPDVRAVLEANAVAPAMNIKIRAMVPTVEPYA